MGSPEHCATHIAETCLYEEAEEEADSAGDVAPVQKQRKRRSLQGSMYLIILYLRHKSTSNAGTLGPKYIIMKYMDS